MKITHYFLLNIILIYSCESPKQEVTTAISGQITNPKGEIITYRMGDESISDTLDSENKFSTTFDIEEPTEIRFGHGDEITYIYLRPGDQLYLSLNTDEFDESINYTGVGSEINNYKAAIVLMSDTIMGARARYMLPPDSFELVLQRINDWKTAALNTFNITDETFKDLTMGEFAWADRLAKLSYKDNYEYLTGGEVELPDDFFAFEKEIDLSDTSQLVYPSFQSFVERKVGMLASERYDQREDSASSYYDYFIPAMEELVSIENIKADMLYGLLNYNYSDLGAKQRELVYEKWIALGPSNEQIEAINDQIAQLKKLEPGKPAPGFTYASIDGDTVSLADFRGKIVYVDVWATWCGPCIREHPYMEKLQQRFEDEDVVFIAVSTDSSPEPWKKMVAEKDLGGLHLYAPGAWKATIMEDYMIKGIPRFILIDRDGNLVDSDADRPSGTIGDQIEQLLKSV